jgi:pimeloyl-ACP methyl ester carboxylesterase
MAAQAKLLAVPPAPDAHYIARDLGPYDAWKVLLETQQATFTETWAWEARDYGLSFKVPVFVFQGENDMNAPVVLARAYFDEIEAPTKAFEVIAGSGHNTLLFADKVLALLDRDVRPLVVRSAAPL